MAKQIESSEVETQPRPRTPQADEEGSVDGEGDVRLAHALRSSNLPFYETVWTVAKTTCTGIVAFGKRFYWDVDARDWEVAKKRANMDKRKSVYVDIVADEGAEWVKVSTISESRLLFEMAKKGWEVDSEDEGEGEEGRTVLRNFEDDAGSAEEDDEDEIELIKLGRDMRKAANAMRVRYRHPRLRVVIPKIEEGKHGDIDGVLNQIRSYGITVECGGYVSSTQIGDHPNVDASDKQGFSHLVPNPFKRFTSTLNVDCTLLLALVSDLSHFKNIQPSPGLHRAINRQIELDKEQPLITTEVWPAMDAHELICTDEAARRMREIVDIIGTDTEKERMKIMMGYSPFEGWDAASLIQKFQELSDHKVPAQWKVPIKIVDAKSAIDMVFHNNKLPPVANEVAKTLSDINHSVFIYGWSTGLTTISSNRTAARQIVEMVEKLRNGDENLEGPQIWVCDTARSLIGKEKGRKN